MSTAKLIVPIETIKENSSIESNAEPAKVRQAALEAQRVELRSILGATLTDYYLNAVQDDGTLSGLTSIQTTFYNDYIVPLFSAYATGAYIYIVHYQISNVGVVTTQGKNNTSASDQAVKDVYRRASNTADHYAQRAKNFICLPENNADLGVYYYASNQNIAPKQKVQSSFIYTPDRNS